MQSRYDAEAVRPMWEELQEVGVKPLTTAEEVEELINKEGTTLIIVNSVCGCAAGGARPGAMLALQNNVIPDHLGTVFAGMDHEAVSKAREMMKDFPPSSPCIALFKDGKPIFVLERFHIEQMDSVAVSNALKEAFNTHCTAQGPSIPADEFEKINPVQKCGSTIPLFGQ